MIEIMLHFFVVLNPKAGPPGTTGIRDAVARHLGGQGISYEIFEFTGAENLHDVVATTLERGTTCVVAAGGDGTISAVADALIGRDALMGILPAGTGNSLARALAIPEDLDAAAALLVGNASVALIDALAVNDQYAVLNVSAGITAVAQDATGVLEKQFLGRMAYGLETIKAALDFAPTRFLLQIDGKEQAQEAMDLTVANGLLLGGLPLDWGPAERLQDRQLDAYLLLANGPLAAGGLLAELILNEESGVYVRHLSVTERVRVVTERPVPVQADGEVIGETPITISLVPSALRVLVPARGRPR